MNDFKTGNSPKLAEIKVHSPVSIVIPTYKEAENIPHILARLDDLRRKHDLILEVLFMDDNSDDGSVEAVEKSGFDWANIIVRTSNRGLSAAVIDGFRAAKYPLMVCMDCDLSHPPEKIPQLLLGLAMGQQMVMGSRYVHGASTDDDWGFLRYLNSIIATLFARPLTKVKDPMSGFFAMRKSDFDDAENLNPVGYKIALELIVKCQMGNVGEVPIHFTDRVYGESKLTLKEQLKYLQHIRRLYLHKFANAMHFAQFMVVGSSGVVVNLAVVSLTQLIGIKEVFCLASGIAVSVVTNFMLNRRFTFSYARSRSISKQFFGFLGASAIGAAISLSVSVGLRRTVFEGIDGGLQIAALCGIACGMVFNYLGNRYVVFRKTHIRN